VSLRGADYPAWAPDALAARGVLDERARDRATRPGALRAFCLSLGAAALSGAALARTLAAAARAS